MIHDELLFLILSCMLLFCILGNGGYISVHWVHTGHFLSFFKSVLMYFGSPHSTFPRENVSGVCATLYISLILGSVNHN